MPTEGNQRQRPCVQPINVASLRREANLKVTCLRMLQ